MGFYRLDARTKSTTVVIRNSTAGAVTSLPMPPLDILRNAITVGILVNSGLTASNLTITGNKFYLRLVGLDSGVSQLHEQLDSDFLRITNANFIGLFALPINYQASSLTIPAGVPAGQAVSFTIFFIQATDITQEELEELNVKFVGLEWPK